MIQMDIAKILIIRKLHRSFKHLFLSISFIIVVLAIGVIGYTHFENLEPFDALYFTIVTLSTIGYGDIYPTSHDARVFTVFFIPLGVATFLYTFSAISMAIFEGRLLEVLKLEQAKEEIKKMKGHVIICGYGDVGEYIAKNLKSIVVIENNEDRYSKIVDDGLLGIHGDSTVTETLREAGIEMAKALVIALNEDPKTVFTILIAKELNPSIKIYARANKKDSVNKIKLAGADYVICIPEIGGREFIRALEKEGS